MALEIVRNEIPVDRVSAFIVDRKQNVLRSLIAQGVDAPISTAIGEGIAGFVAQTRQALDVQDAYADARFNHGEVRIKSWLVGSRKLGCGRAALSG